jgi:hypothetical protein
MGDSTIMAKSLSNLGIQTFPIIENANSAKPIGNKIKSLQDLGIETFPIENNPQSVQSPMQSLNPVEEYYSPEYTGKNSGFANLKNGVAGFVGGLPDIGVSAHNVFSKEENQWPYVTDMIANKIDEVTGGLTKDTDPYSKNAVRFLFSLFGGGAAGKAIEAAGAAAKGLGAAGQTIGKGVEKTGSFIKNYLGVTKPSAQNVTAGLAAGATLGAAEEGQFPAYISIPAVIGAYALGGYAGGKTANVLKNNLKPLFEKVPGLENFILKQNYEELAKQITPEAIQDLMRTSIIDKEISFLTEKTIADLPKEIQVKLQENPALLNDQEINTVIQNGMKEFLPHMQNLEKEYGIPLLLNELTGSPKLTAKADALANKPNIEQFDISTKNRRLKVVQRLEKLKSDLSKESPSSEQLGERITKEVETVYRDAEKLRSENWNKNFGKVVDENIIPVSNYISKLKEFAQLRPDTMGNEVAIKSATKKLKDGIDIEKNISPKRINDILVGLNEDISRFPDKSFSRSQIKELKDALQADLDQALEHSLTAEQAMMVKNARSSYAEDSKILNELNDSVLFSKINEETLKVPEKVAKALDGMPSSQLKLTFNALKRSSNAEEVIPQIQRYYIEQAAKVATKNGSDTFNPKTFLDKLPKKEEFDVIFEGTNAYKEIKDLSVLLRRISKFEPQRGNSKTAQRLEESANEAGKAAKAVSSIAKGNLGDALSSLASYFQKGSNSDKIIADIMISPQHRAEILGKIGQQKTNPFVATATQALVQSNRKKTNLQNN